MSSEIQKLEIGTVIASRYTVEKSLGSGGMGAVYLAQDSYVNGDLVAIKILHPDLVVDAKQSQRFMREVQLMRKVDHANVVRTYDVGSDGELVFFTMEYVPGRSLEDFIEGQNFPKEKIPQLIMGVAAGLEAIHKANIIHRDLKPANILVLENFQPKITDFGVARPEYSELTAHNEIIGSALYIAPEVWLGTKLTSSVDLYSFGVVLYELTTGTLPFDGDSPASLMRMHLEFKPTPPKEINPEIPVWLNKLILNLLAKTAEDRPRDAAEVIDYVEAQTNTGQRKAVSEDKFINELELAASQLDTGKDKILTPRNKTLVMDSDKVGTEKKKDLKAEILATLLCFAIAATFYFSVDSILTLARESVFSELNSVIMEPFKWNFESLAKLPLASGFLLLVAFKVVFSGAGLYLPIGAACGSLKSTLRLFLLGFVWSSVVALAYFIVGLVSASGNSLLLLSPDGFSLVVSSLRLALASLAIDPKIWTIQKVIFEQGIVFYPEAINPPVVKSILFLQFLPLLALAIITCKMAKFTAWKTTGTILGILSGIFCYFLGGIETEFLFDHSNKFSLATILLIYSVIVFIKRLSVTKVSQRN